ncbi:MAG: tetratricopeptide repeat protein [Sphingobacteriaceae bacterium]|nr:tetratricopeptide repeat protein [Sphingobacteriaceae bacterium]
MKQRFFFTTLLFFILHHSYTYAQTSTLQTSAQITHLSLADTVEVKRLNKKAEEFVRTSVFDSAIYYGEKSRIIANKLDFEFGEAEALGSIGIASWYQGNFNKAMESFFTALSIFENINHEKGVSNCLNNIGIIFASEKKYDDAEIYYKRTLILKRKLNDVKGISSTLINLGSVYEYRQLYDSALKYYHDALVIKKEISQPKGIAIALNNIGNAMYLKGINNANEAIAYLSRSLKIRDSISDLAGVASTSNLLGNVFLDLNNFTQAEIYLLKAQNILESITNLEQTYKNQDLLAKLYKKTGRFKEAFTALEKAKISKDSLIVLDNRNDILKIELKHDFEKEKLEIEKENSIQAAILASKKQRQNILTWSVSIVLLLVLIMSVFIYNRYRLTHKQKIIIEKHQKDTLDSIHYAKRIQTTLLAHTDFIDQILPQNFILYKPKDIVSGDFYWATKTDKYFYLAVCDSTGHGVPGAFMSLLNISFMAEAINEKNITEPGEVFQFVRQRLIDNISKEGQKDGFDGVLLRFEITNTANTRTINYAAANNSPVLISNGNLSKFANNKMPVGMGISNEPFTTFETTIKKGDVLYLFTDGYSDQFGGSKGKKFMNKNLKDTFLNIQRSEMKGQQEELNLIFEAWKGSNEQIDDVCVIGLKF